MVLVRQEDCVEKNTIMSINIILQKLNLKWISDPKVRPDTLRVMEGLLSEILIGNNHGDGLNLTGTRKDFLNRTLPLENNKWDFMKLKFLAGSRLQNEKRPLPVSLQLTDRYY